MTHFIDLGNIFELEGITSYAHGCNCSGAMGKGIAVQFRDKFPEMYYEYKQLCKSNKFNLGDIYVFNYGNGFVFNLGTQQSWKTKAELTAIEQSLKKMFDYASNMGIDRIAIPRIGAGLGGLKWEDVKVIIEKISNQYPTIELFVVENYG
ncbi:MAG: macro domain-containing protein [Chitinophagaceae bacterium]|jgi:O-acetyl-ADP-ribose deacetylase (regulator of RNase III)|nr:macro domain-containing protein [Chitinophagaceae bacterium]